MSSCTYMNTSVLPSDIIIIEILSRLRAKTLFRLCCISKSWYSLISDPWFIELHHRQSKQNPLIILPYYNFPTFSFSFVEKDGTLIHQRTIDGRRLRPSSPQSLMPVQTCMDLVCMRDFVNYVCIINPTTREIFELPKKPAIANQVGFGYVPSTDEYKVLSVSRYSRCEIFVLGSDRWRDVEECPLETQGNAACVDGCVYLLCSKFYEGIVKFDLKEEKWTTLPIPKIVNNSKSWKLMAAGEILCLLDFKGDSHQSSMVDIWWSKDCNSGKWTYECRIDFPMPIPAVYFAPLAIEEDGRILVVLMERLLYYHPKERKYKGIASPGRISMASLYVENLRTFGCLTKRRSKIKTWLSLVRDKVLGYLIRMIKHK